MAAWSPRQWVHCWAPQVSNSAMAALLCSALAATVAAALVGASLERKAGIWRSPWSSSWLSRLWLRVPATVVSKIGRALRGIGRRPRHRVLLLGLDNAGKTALCHLLSRNCSSWQPRPEHHVLHHRLDLGDCVLDFVDPSGNWQRCSVLWEQLLHSRPDAVAFVVDAADGAKLAKARSALHWALRHPAVQGLPVLVLGNKVDLRQALGSWDLACRLGLSGLSKEQRESLMGSVRARTSGTGGMPLELRRRIASFHPDEADSPPHGGPLAVHMCSVARQWFAHASIRWLATRGLPSGGGDRTRSGTGLALCKHGWAAGIAKRLRGGCALFGDGAAMLPL